jgi:hypothetical protein
MHRTYVKSSTIHSVGYETLYQTLEIKFTNEEVYRYFKVPESHYSGLLKAASHGRYFNQHIKDHYLYRKVT